MPEGRRVDARTTPAGMPLFFGRGFGRRARRADGAFPSPGRCVVLPVVFVPLAVRRYARGKR